MVACPFPMRCPVKQYITALNNNIDRTARQIRFQRRHNINNRRVGVGGTSDWDTDSSPDSSRSFGNCDCVWLLQAFRLDAYRVTLA